MDGPRYRVLYRAFRPARWADLVGQEHVARSLRNAVGRGRAAHAYLLSGPRGTGKTTIAKILARALNCLDPDDGEPCGACDACARILAGSTTDVVELDAASNRGIDEMRALREQTRYAPAQEKVKVYIVDEVHMLTQEAANALLKTLEEPPPRLCFVLCTTDPERLPSTVLSRCQRFALRRLTLDEIADRLGVVARAEGMRLDPVAARDLARRADGGMRDALALLEQVRAFAGDAIDTPAVLAALGGVPVQSLADLADILARGDAGGAFGWLDARWGEGADARMLASALRDLWHAWLLASLGVTAAGESASGYPAPPVGYGRDRLMGGLERWVQAARETRMSDDPRLDIEVALLQAIQETVGPGPTATVAALEGRVQALEAALRSSAAAPAPATGQVAREAPAPTRVSRPAVTAQAATGAAVTTGDPWRDALERLRRTHPRVGALLAAGHVVEVTPEHILVAVPYEFHHTALQEPDARTAAEAALAQAYGGLRRLKVTLGRAATAT